MGTLRIAIFASHNGSTMQAILDACFENRIDAIPCVVISNNRNSVALQRSKAAGVPSFLINSQTHPDEDERDAYILEVLRNHQTDFVILAGYMKKIGPRTLGGFEGKILNTHPALLPKFGGQGMYGMHVHEAVLAAGERESGATVHVIDEEYDHGPIIAQKVVSVHPSDTPETLRDRVAEAERALYVETIGRIADRSLVIPERR